MQRHQISVALSYTLQALTTLGLPSVRLYVNTCSPPLDEFKQRRCTTAGDPNAGRVEGLRFHKNRFFFQAYSCILTKSFPITTPPVCPFGFLPHPNPQMTEFAL